MTGFTPEEWRTAARVARRSIFTEGNPDLADAWEKAADQAEAHLISSSLTTQLAKLMFEGNAGPGWSGVSESVREIYIRAADTVLAHLQSAGRLVPAGGMALTAEQVEDVRTVAFTKSGSDTYLLAGETVDRLRALFPATEPAEGVPARCTESIGLRGTIATCELEEGHGGRHFASDKPPLPAPAEPAEEETKAEDEPRIWGINTAEPSDVQYVRDRFGNLFKRFAPDTWRRWRPAAERFREADWTWVELASDLPVEVLGTPLELTPPTPVEPAEEVVTVTDGDVAAAWEDGFTAGCGHASADCQPRSTTFAAEEEVKAEDYCCHPKCRFTDWGGISRKHERGADCPIVPKPAPSPVVPPFVAAEERVQSLHTPVCGCEEFRVGGSCPHDKVCATCATFDPCDTRKALETP